MTFLPVVTPVEMARIEQWDVQHGANARTFMLEAGKQVALAALKKLENKKKVALLIGKGNKGGDGYVAGIHLLREGIDVQAFAFFPQEECSELNREFGKEFKKARGQICFIKHEQELDWKDADLLIDALLGTGFQGAVIGVLAFAIQQANRSEKPILAIDMPSGLDAEKGVAAPCAIVARETVTMGLPKIGCFLRDGWNYTGRLRIADIGLSEQACRQATALARIPKLEDLRLPPMIPSHHKYQRGFALGFGGSTNLKGAIKLSAAAALHAGAGIVKVFTLEDIGPVADELICQMWDGKAWKEAMQKASALFVGPGLGRTESAKQWLVSHLKGVEKPCVLDADALYFFRTLEHWPVQCILTPHRGEMLSLLGESEQAEEEVFLQQCQRFAANRNVILILKGAPTFIFIPKEIPVIVPRGDPGMATAGSGDVLTGILAALLAQGKPLAEAAILGVAMHALAGEAAADEKTSYGYTASDLISYLPKAFEFFIHSM